MPVVLDEKESLFQEGECPDAALYCGWYSLANYVDAFKWVPGSIGYHIASVECETLRRPGNRLWCETMLEKGVAATIGPVAEPYVQGFRSRGFLWSHYYRGSDISGVLCACEPLLVLENGIDRRSPVQAV